MCAPEPDGQSVHEEDEIYVLLEGSATLLMEDERQALRPGEAFFVPKGVRHRFVDYTVLKLLVIFQR